MSALAPESQAAEAPHCTFSGMTGTYVAKPGAGCDSDVLQYLKDAGEVFAVATNAYLNSAYVETATTTGLPMHRVGGWQNFARRVVAGYTAAHFRLIQQNAEYRDGLHDIMIVNATMHGYAPDRPARTARGEAQRRRQEGHKMVKNAVTEGVPTLVAVYQVVPAVVDLELPDIAPEERAAVSAEVLPSAAKFSKRLAYHSKDGDETFLQRLSRKKAGKGTLVKYSELELDPMSFELALPPAQPPVMTVKDIHVHPNDVEKYFTGCPAIFGGSVWAINRLIKQTLQSEQCYLRAHLGEHAVVGSLRPAVGLG